MRWILCFFQSAAAHPDKGVPGVYQTLRQGLDGIYWIELAAWPAFLQLAKCHPFDVQIFYMPPLLDKKSSSRKDVRHCNHNNATTHNDGKKDINALR